MDEILSALLNSVKTLEDRRVEQIVGICGEGLLSDTSDCSVHFREFLKNVPSRILHKYAHQCLDGSNARSPNSGLILQDLVNEVGDRLGFTVTPGFYRGSPNRIGNDGLWKADDYSFILEVKTSDLSVKLENIARYREKLIESKQITAGHSSILIVLGRQDTGDLEAQIRGSKYAWSIRMIGIEAILRLLEIKEKLNDRQTIYRITELLKPIEYTRVDKLIDIVFSASWDISGAEEDDVSPEDMADSTAIVKKGKPPIAESLRKHASPVNFYENCIEHINKKLNKHFIRDGKVTYISSDKTTRLVLLNSKTHSVPDGSSFWYGFRPNQDLFLREKSSSFIAFGCGREDSIILMPFSDFQQYLPEMTTSHRDGQLTHHNVTILKRGPRFSIRLSDRVVDVSKFAV